MDEQRSSPVWKAPLAPAMSPAEDDAARRLEEISALLRAGRDIPPSEELAKVIQIATAS